MPSRTAPAESQPAPAPRIPRLIPVVRWGEFHEWPPEGGMRHLIFHRETNGFKEAFVHAGGRVLVDEEKFFECVARRNAEKGCDR